MTGTIIVNGIILIAAGYLLCLIKPKRLASSYIRALAALVCAVGVMISLYHQPTEWVYVAAFASLLVGVLVGVLFSPSLSLPDSDSGPDCDCHKKK